MPNWGEVEAEEEVAHWLESLTDREFGQAEFYIDLLAAEGVTSTSPTAGNSRGSYESFGSTWAALANELPISSSRDAASSS
jgi:hypothetical protein